MRYCEIENALVTCSKFCYWVQYCLQIPDIANLHGEIDEDFNSAYGKAVERLSRVTFINKSFRRTSNISSDGAVSPNDITPPRYSRLSTALGNHSPGEGLVGSLQQN